MHLKLSIVTATLNRAADLEKTILSICHQKIINNNIEFIIIDGGSTDDTHSICNKYKFYIDKFISEKDNGLYDAMNKGAFLCTGDIIMFLNSGDLILYLDTNLPSMTSTSYYLEKDTGLIIREPLTKSFLSRNTVCHQSIFYLRNDFVPFPLNFGIFSDYIHSMNYTKAKAVFNSSIILFDTPTLSNDNYNYDEIIHNYKLRLYNVFIKFGPLYCLITLLSLIYKLIRMFVVDFNSFLLAIGIKNKTK